MKLLLVEDEKTLSKVLGKGLEKSGYAVDYAYDGETALALFEINNYDLMILDLNLPKLDGLEVLNRIRKQDQTFRILILSARGNVEDRVEGFNQGANDYLTKPFDFRELEARVRSLLHREFIQKAAVLFCGGLQVDTSKKAVYWKKSPLPLTKKEYGILEYLLLTERTVSAEELVEHVWDSETDLFSNTLKFHISSLRKKLAEASENSVEIITLRGQGYRISSKGETI